VKKKNGERINASIPRDVIAWLRDRVEYLGSTLSAEMTRSIRERMEREVAKDRAATPEQRS
jgi:hypothetical protein